MQPIYYIVIYTGKTYISWCNLNRDKTISKVIIYFPIKLFLRQIFIYLRAFHLTMPTIADATQRRMTIINKY
jgi:hypothetical protein